MPFAKPATIMLASCTIGLVVLAPLTHADTDPNQQIRGLVQQLADEPSENRRAELADQIAYAVQTTRDTTHFDRDTVDAIASLLQHEDGTVVFWSAVALGQIGPAARPIVPALESALDRELAKEEPYPIKTGIWPSDGVCVALHNINEANHPKCQLP